MKHVIVGNGVAGVTAAQSILRADPSGEVHLFGAESHPYYRRPRLWEFIAGQIEQDALYVEKARMPPQLAVGRNGKRGPGSCRPPRAFSFEEAPQLAAGFFTSARPTGMLNVFYRRRVGFSS